MMGIFSAQIKIIRKVSPLCIPSASPCIPSTPFLPTPSPTLHSLAPPASRLSEVTLDMATEGTLVSSRRAMGVEQCSCPKGYEGLSCQNPSTCKGGGQCSCCPKG